MRLPNGAPLVAADDIASRRASACWSPALPAPASRRCSAPSPGIWPFGTGTIAVPEDARVMILPQRPYFPVGTLAAAVSYPAEPGTFNAEQLAEVLAAVGLPALAERLDEEAHWNRMLSLGEQQRLGIARAILQAPDFLFLDEATASLDEPAEAALYAAARAAAGTTIVSIGHRSTLAAFHKRRLTLTREGERHRVAAAARRRQPNRRSPPADRPGAATEQVVPDEGPRPRAVTRQWPGMPRESPRTCCCHDDQLPDGRSLRRRHQQ